MELAEDLTQIRDENLQLRELLGVESEIIGSSQVMHKVQRDIGTGGAESGHGANSRRKRRGERTGCTGDSLFQSAQKRNVLRAELRRAVGELIGKRMFGHERGAFTRRDRTEDGKV